MSHPAAAIASRATGALRHDPVLTIAALLAVASCALVPPDAGYADYVDFRTLGLLFSLMTVMAGLSRIGVFAAAGNALLARTHSGTSAVMGLVLLPFVASMLVTNDVSLIAFVPFALLVLRMLGIADASVFTVVMMTIAANLGSMLTPIGNPQNLYLYSASGMGVGEFVGLMLPYTPVHWLLFHSLAGKPNCADWTEELALDEALVMTSANRSGDPLVIDNDEAYEKLADIADFWLIHNRDILVRCDDSVVRLMGETPVFIRRSRGYAPEAIRFKDNFEPTLAAGAYLKNTAALTRDNEVFLTQHIGDLENTATERAYEKAVNHLETLFEIKPTLYAADAHPDFASSRYAAHLAKANNAHFLPIYHHAAHIGVAMAEVEREEPTLGLALDGVGLGPNHEAWGSELLLVTAGHFARLGHLEALPLPGGDRAALEPMRMAASVLTLLGMQDDISQRYPDLPQAAHFGELVRNPHFSPLTTSLGRYFDAASSLLGLCDKQHDDARAAMLLESLAYQALGEEHLDGFVFLDEHTVSLLPFMRFLASNGMKNPAQAAADFHETVALALATLTQKEAQRIGYAGPIMLTGGCMANRLLTQALTEKLHALGFQTYYPVKVPAGDGGLALGQVWLTHLAKKADKDAFRYDGEL